MYKPELDQLLHGLAPYSGEVVANNLVWPFVDYVSDRDWRNQGAYHSTFAPEPARRTIVNGVRYEVSTYAEHKPTEPKHGPLIDYLEFGESHAFASLVIEEVLKGEERENGIELFARQNSHLFADLGQRALIVKDTTALKVHTQHHTEVMRYRSVESIRDNKNYWVIAGEDPRKDDEYESSARLTDHNMQMLGIALVAYEAPLQLKNAFAQFTQAHSK